jgi:hypothetical protein
MTSRIFGAKMKKLSYEILLPEVYFYCESLNATADYRRL